ncbi:MAG: hypothetical protein QOH21_647 [Acidobacteriota bacterium]|jgi:hypothetical protein|nr:hypothetical protein [Acidobacteriota bacterium]
MRILLPLLLASSLIAAVPAQAQQCTQADTVLTCWQRFVPPVPALTPAQQQTAATTATQQTVAAANTGITTLTSPADSAIKDFLTLFTASLESATLQDSGEALTFDWNPQLPILGTTGALKVQAVLGNAQLSAQATTSLAGNATAISDLTSSINYGDDIALSLSVNPTTERLGRSIGPNRDYFETWLLHIVPPQGADDQAFTAALVAANMGTNQQFQSLPAEQRQSTQTAVETAARAQAAVRNSIRRFSVAFATLLNNQSQFHGSAIRTMRRNIVGTNEWSADLTYEWGPRNLTSFRKKFAGTCGPDKIITAAIATNCAQTMETYAQEAATDRLAFTAEYHVANQRWIDLPQYSVAYSIPRARTMVYSLKYGRPLAPVVNKSGGRIDLDVDFEDVSSQADVKNRLVASLTYTYKVSDTVSIPVGLVYASHEKDLPTTDEKINAHFGVLFKMPNLPFGQSN